LRVEGLGLRAYGKEFRVQDLGLNAFDKGYRVKGSR
jgi:hypothetical protein